ncbi:MAG: PKD domain-containing protein [Chitinivibrionales bacterium]|nr:PKD domain-containing protein [Chitinivibrionales bacterium]
MHEYRRGFLHDEIDHGALGHVGLSSARNEQPRFPFLLNERSYDWDFGDGSPMDYSNAPSHEYTREGEYTVTLRVVDSRDMRSEPVTLTISVGPVGADVKRSVASRAGTPTRVVVMDLAGRIVHDGVQRLRAMSDARLPALPRATYIVRIGTGGSVAIRTHVVAGSEMPRIE